MRKLINKTIIKAPKELVQAGRLSAKGEKLEDLGFEFIFAKGDYYIRPTSTAQGLQKSALALSSFEGRLETADIKQNIIPQFRMTRKPLPKGVISIIIEDLRVHPYRLGVSSSGSLSEPPMKKIRLFKKKAQYCVEIIGELGERTLSGMLGWNEHKKQVINYVDKRVDFTDLGKIKFEDWIFTSYSSLAPVFFRTECLIKNLSYFFSSNRDRAKFYATKKYPFRFDSLIKAREKKIVEIITNPEDYEVNFKQALLRYPQLFSSLGKFSPYLSVNKSKGTLQKLTTTLTVERKIKRAANEGPFLARMPIIRYQMEAVLRAYVHLFTKEAAKQAIRDELCLIGKKTAPSVTKTHGQCVHWIRSLAIGDGLLTSAILELFKKGQSKLPADERTQLLFASILSAAKPKNKATFRSVHGFFFNRPDPLSKEETQILEEGLDLFKNSVSRNGGK